MRSLTLIACLLLATAADAAPLQFVYKGAGCDGRKAVPSFEAVLGRRADGVVDFVNYLADWPGAVSASKWGSKCWKGSGYRLAWSVPLAVSKGPNASLADVAAGRANGYFSQIADDLVAQGHADAYIRLGWEFNGGWYPWGGHHPSDVAEAYRQAHDAMSSRPGSHFRFVWNPSLYMQGFWPDQAYPGDAYVDIVAVDAYAAAWKQTVPERITALAVGDDDMQWNVKHVVAFAKAHHKPFAFPEWGTGTNRGEGRNPGAGDYPPFIEAMTPYIRASEFAGYWDYPAHDMDGSFAHNPQSAAAFRAAFGGRSDH